MLYEGAFPPNMLQRWSRSFEGGGFLRKNNILNGIYFRHKWIWVSGPYIKVQSILYLVKRPKVSCISLGLFVCLLIELFTKVTPKIYLWSHFNSWNFKLQKLLYKILFASYFTSKVNGLLKIRCNMSCTHHVIFKSSQLVSLWFRSSKIT